MLTAHFNSDFKTKLSLSFNIYHKGWSFSYLSALSSLHLSFFQSLLTLSTECRTLFILLFYTHCLSDSSFWYKMMNFLSCVLLAHTMYSSGDQSPLQPCLRGDHSPTPSHQYRKYISLPFSLCLSHSTLGYLRQDSSQWCSYSLLLVCFLSLPFHLVGSPLLHVPPCDLARSPDTAAHCISSSISLAFCQFVPPLNTQ